MNFRRLVQLIAAGDTSQGSYRPARTLWAIRWKLGELLGWDSAHPGHGWEQSTLRDRLPAELRDAPSVPAFDTLPFTSLYLLADEWAAKIANHTRRHAHRLGPRPDRRLPRPDGRPREAKRTARYRLHGRDQAVPAPDRVPGDHA
jgi:hypothetical protein